MRKAFSLRNKNHDFNIERYKTRLTAKFCVIFVAVTQIILRLINVFTEKTLPTLTLILYCISLPLLGLMALVVIVEYLVYRRIGPRILDYSKLIDIFLLIAFTAEWLVTLLFPMSRLAGTNPPALSVNSLYGLTSFSWRILLLLFLIQSWKLLIIPPVLALGMVMGFAVHYSTMGLVFHFLRGIPQVVYVIMLLYFLDKIRWREVFTNVQQERWMQINDFILNNIPENIVILELGGQVRFVSEYCRSFMRKAHVSQDPNELFGNIRDLNQQPDTEPSSPTNNESLRQTERLTTTTNLLVEPTDNKTILNFQQVEDLQNLISNFKAIIRDARIQEKQFLLYNGKLKVEDHPQKAIEIKISYIIQHNKEYIILIIRDTTQRDLLVTLEDNNKYKDQLLASVSHELRAPLNGNINLVESALQAVNVPESIKERMLTPALRSSKFLLHIINDILDMSQIKAQKLRLIFRSSSLRETLQDTLQLVELQARRKGLDLRLIIHPDLIESELCTDHMRLSQIVLNLLNNSIKFTQKGTITLSALPTDDPMCHKISIQDSGIGMNQEDMKKLFSDYTHIEFSGRAEINPTGVGLGLNIAYSLAKLLGPKDHNSIAVESTPSIGSTFSFIIENREDQQQLEPQDILAGKKPNSEKSQGIPDEYLVIEPKIITRTCRSFSTNLIMRNNEAKSSKKPEEEECKCAKILVVDDNLFNTMAFEAVLGSLNHKCDAVFDGQSAIDKILERQEKLCGKNCKPYNVIFMDQEMPGMTGSETVCKIKSLQAQGHVPPMKIIGCTAHGCAREVEKFMESGIDSCIHKPISPQELQKALGDMRN